MEKSQETKKYFKVNYFKYTYVYMCMYVYIQETALGIFLSSKTILKSQKCNIHNMAIWIILINWQLTLQV